MDQDNYETLTLSAETLGEDRQLLVDNVLVQVQKYNGSPIGLQFPAHVELTVTSTEPGVRGDTASGSVTKVAITIAHSAVVRHEKYSQSLRRSTLSLARSVMSF